MNNNPTFWNDLPKLEDIQNKLDIEDNNNKLFDDKDIEEFKESVVYFIDDFIKNNVRIYKEYKFNNIVYVYLYNCIINTYGFIIDEFNFDLESNICDAIEIYFSKNNSFRAYSGTCIVNFPNKKEIKKLLKSCENVEQPEQLSEEWYKFRREGLSASDIWKALDTESARNNLILSKCKPIDLSKKNSVNINSPFHNGHKYEPLSIMLYEYDNKTQVGEFGCIKHREYDFLRASPDGINIKEDSPLYGRLVEVKNPVSRELTGTPKKDYWIQMQLQMEVWNLNECDFLETVFKTYENEDAFYNDGDCFTRTTDGKRKGIIVQFYFNEKPHYEYCPVDMPKKEFNNWYDKIMEKNKQMTWVTNCYWYLKDYSCVLVPRNKLWFKTVYPDLKKTWDTVLKERETGYEHRKPKKRKKKSTKLTPKTLEKLKTDTQELFKDSSLSPNIGEHKNIIIKVRTESFDFPDN
jgi:putative phage-type endonuclease